MKFLLHVAELGTKIKVDIKNNKGYFTGIVVGDLGSESCSAGNFYDHDNYITLKFTFK